MIPHNNIISTCVWSLRFFCNGHSYLLDILVGRGHLERDMIVAELKGTPVIKAKSYKRGVAPKVQFQNGCPRHTSPRPLRLRSCTSFERFLSIVEQRGPHLTFADEFVHIWSTHYLQIGFLFPVMQWACFLFVLLWIDPYSVHLI